MAYSLTPPENQEAPEIAVVPVLPAVAVPQAILPQAIIAPGVIHIAQDNAKAQPAQEAPAIVLAHAPAVIQLDANEDAQIAQDIAITPQANAAPAAAQQTQLDQCISPQDIRANIIALAACLARRTESIEVTRVGWAVEQANIVQRKSHTSTGCRKQASKTSTAMLPVHELHTHYTHFCRAEHKLTDVCT